MISSSLARFVGGAAKVEKTRCFSAFLDGVRAFSARKGRTEEGMTAYFFFCSSSLAAGEKSPWSSFSPLRYDTTMVIGRTNREGRSASVSVVVPSVKSEDHSLFAPLSSSALLLPPILSEINRTHSKKSGCQSVAPVLAARRSVAWSDWGVIPKMSGVRRKEGEERK